MTWIAAGAPRASSAAAPIECLARGVNLEKGWSRKASVSAACQPVSSGGTDQSAAFGTKRFCAACLVTPIDWPISVQDAPALRAWSTKCPIRWSASSRRCSEIRMAADTWSRAVPSRLLT